MGHSPKLVFEWRSAQEVFGRLSPVEALDYNKTKLALLQRFRFTTQGYCGKFRHSKPQDNEMGVQYAAKLTSSFDKWVEMSKIEKEYSAVRNLVVAEQFRNSCHDKVALFLREKNCRKVEEMAEAADNFLEARRQTNLLVFRKKKENTSAGKGANTTSNVPTRCFVCDKSGHIAAKCRSRKRQSFCRFCHKPGHDSQACTNKTATTRKTSCIWSPNQNCKEVDEVDDNQNEDCKASAVNMRPKMTKRPMPVFARHHAWKDSISIARYGK